MGNAFHILVLLLVGGASACAGGRVSRGIFRKAEAAYRVIDFSAWHPVSFRDNDLAFTDEKRRFLLGVNSTCQGHKDAPLKILTQDLLLGFEHRQLLGRRELQIDRRAAMRSHFRAELDGVPVELDLTVLKKDGCVYDFIYVAPQGRLLERQRDYESLLRTFTTEVS